MIQNREKTNMNAMKIKKWIYDLKRLPNKKRGFASALCDVALMLFAVVIYRIAKLLGYELSINWLIGFLVAAKILATPLFFAWAQFAMNLGKTCEEKNPG